MAKLPVIIIGDGAEARLAAEALMAQDVLVYGFVATNELPEAAEICDAPVLGLAAEPQQQKLLKDEKSGFAIALRESAEREAWLNKLFKLTSRLPVNAAHPSAVVSAYGELAAGNILGPYCVVGYGANVQALNVFGPHCTVGEGAEIGSFNTFGEGARIGADVVVGSNVDVGAGAILFPGVKVGARATVAAGAVVMKDVSEGAAVFGNPAQTAGG